MAEEKVESRETTWRQLLPWTELFRGFQVALDLNKLALAAAGIMVMAFGWWLLSLIFTAGESHTAPAWPPVGVSRPEFDKDPQRFWNQFKQDRDHWNLMHEAAGVDNTLRDKVPVEVPDVIDTYDEYQKEQLAVKDYNDVKAARSEADKALTTVQAAAGDPAKIAAAEKALAEANAAVRAKGLDDYLKERGFPEAKAKVLAAIEQHTYDHYKPYALLSTWPWYENRGPNPFLLVTGQSGKPWEVGHFWEWFFSEQAPVLVEPVVKLLRPIIYFFRPGADFLSCLYFLCVLLWMVATWSLFGGAITRIAAVQVARGEKIGLVEALRFTGKRILSYLTAPLFPLGFVFILLLALIVFGGLVQLIPFLGDLWSGLLWGVWLVLGLLMTLTLVGLVGWPLMSATISAEGTDSWEAVSRAYSYVFQKPWNFLWYALVAITYGAAVVFFVGFLGSATVYLTKWSVSRTPGMTWAGREPSYLFVYAPTSFGWRELLLSGGTVDGEKLVVNGKVNDKAYSALTGYSSSGPTAEGEKPAPAKMVWWNHVGAFLTAIWLFLFFLLILGFGYSFFWSTSTIVYMLLRRNVDAAELDEVYLEEDDAESNLAGPLTQTAPPPTAVKPGAASLTMVDAPSLRPPPAHSPPPPAAVVPPPPAPVPAPVAAPPPAPLPDPFPEANEEEPPPAAPPPPEPPPEDRLPPT